MLQKPQRHVLAILDSNPYKKGCSGYGVPLVLDNYLEKVCDPPLRRMVNTKVMIVYYCSALIGPVWSQIPFHKARKPRKINYNAISQGLKDTRHKAPS